MMPLWCELIKCLRPIHVSVHLSTPDMDRLCLAGAWGGRGATSNSSTLQASPRRFYNSLHAKFYLEGSSIHVTGPSRSLSSRPTRATPRRRAQSWHRRRPTSPRATPTSPSRSGRSGITTPTTPTCAARAGAVRARLRVLWGGGWPRCLGLEEWAGAVCGHGHRQRHPRQAAAIVLLRGSSSNASLQYELVVATGTNRVLEW